VAFPAIPLWENEIPGFDPAIQQEPPRLEPYLLAGDGPQACIIVCPGGGYWGHAPHEGAPVAQWLNRLGISAFVLFYRTAPYHHPIPLLDAQRAVRLVRSRANEFGVDPDRVGMLGFSAGGHLVSTVGTHFDAGDERASDPVERASCRPDALVLCYPVISFGEFRHDGSRQALLGTDNPPASLVNLLSNELQVTPQTPPTFLWHTANDDGVPVENSLLFAAALSRNKVPFELHIFPDGQHGLGLAQEHPALSLWTKACENWLRAAGFAC